MVRGARTAGLRLVVVAVLAVVASACEPPPPPTAIAVTTTDPGADHAPGDGTCEVTPGLGDCSLQAAIEEGGTAVRADLTVPAGRYDDVDVVANGRLRINWGAPADVVVGDAMVTVAVGASLAVDGLRSAPPDEQPGGALPLHHPVAVTVSGSLTVRDSILTRFFSDGPATGAAVTVTPTGGAVIEQSIIGGGTVGVVNDGRLVVLRSSLFAEVGPSLRTGATGVSVLGATVLSTVSPAVRVFSSCDGGVTSLGFNGAERGGCGFSHPTDLDQSVTGYGYGLDGPEILVGSPVVDAIPLGASGCDPSGVDLFGHPRGVDGNGDGTEGCDVGAVEVQP